VTKAEQETVIRWDQAERMLYLYTAYPADARKWARLGYSVEIFGRTQSGEPRSWKAKAPLEALTFRKLTNGQVARRRRGRSFGLEARKLAPSEQRSRQERSRGRFHRVERSKAAN
jgi:hypothetical protein